MSIPVVLANYRKAGDRCSKLQDCNGAEALNYHVNFGFYLGCQLAKRGFHHATINKLFADGITQLFDDAFLLNDLSCRATDGKGPLACYRFNLCTDVPRLLEYVYKRTTLRSHLFYGPQSAALALFNLGYHTPFQAEEKDPKRRFVCPADWSEKKFRTAATYLDFHLMQLLYGAEQGRVGTELGAGVCQEYKEKIKPKGLSHNADVLFEKGLFAKKLSLIEEERLPDHLRKRSGKARSRAK